MAKYFFKSDKDAQLFMKSIIKSTDFKKLIDNYLNNDALNTFNLLVIKNNYQGKNLYDNKEVSVNLTLASFI